MSQTRENKKGLLSVVCAALLLSACGGSSSSSTTVVRNETPPEDTSSGHDDFSGTDVQPYLVGEDATLEAGLFLAEITYKETDADGNRITDDALMTLSATGNFTLVFDPDTITVGTLTLEGDVIEASVTDYLFAEGEWQESERATISGFVAPPESPEDARLEPGGRIENVLLTRDPGLSDQDPGQELDFEKISGTYSMSQPGSPSITINGAGEITGTVSECILNGQVEIPESGLNIYELSYTASNCDTLGQVSSSQRNGKYLGVGLFYPDSTTGTGTSEIDFAASNGKITFFFAGTR